MLGAGESTSFRMEDQQVSSRWLRRIWGSACCSGRWSLQLHLHHGTTRTKFAPLVQWRYAFPLASRRVGSLALMMLSVWDMFHVIYRICYIPRKKSYSSFRVSSLQGTSSSSFHEWRHTSFYKIIMSVLGPATSTNVKPSIHTAQIVLSTFSALLNKTCSDNHIGT